MDLTITADNGQIYSIQNIPTSINKYDKKWARVSHRDLDVINMFVKHPIDVKTQKYSNGILACNFNDIKQEFLHEFLHEF